VRTDQAGVQNVAVPGLQVPTDQNGRFWVHFHPNDRGRYISAKDVLQGRAPRDRVEGKLVLIGASAVGLLDVKTTPVSAAIPGVEVQILESVLRGKTQCFLVIEATASGVPVRPRILGSNARKYSAFCLGVSPAGSIVI
jgi:CHASE2 domain-containing sensor protein